MTADATDRPEIGLCARCTHAIVQRSAKGNEFWRCGAADTDSRLLRYPPLPVAHCLGFASSQERSES